MCGIAGIDRAEASTEVEQMLQQLRHRGPDGSGCDSVAGRTLDHTRLAQTWNYHLANKEALYYYRLLRESCQDDHIFPTMGHSRSL